MAERTDTERLDWLDQTWVKIHKFPHFNWMDTRSDVHLSFRESTAGRRMLSHKRLREAIDAAMDAEEEHDAD